MEEKRITQKQLKKEENAKMQTQTQTKKRKAIETVRGYYY